MRIGKALAGLLLVSVAGLAMLTPASSVAQESVAMKQVGLVRTGSGTFTMDVEGADIRTVVRAIAEFSGHNIVVANDVKATVHVSLHNVDWQDALRTVLRTNGLDYVSEGGIIRVEDTSKLASELAERAAARAKEAENSPLETRVLKLNYANANELMTSIQGSMSRRGTVQAEKRTNSLIITDVPSGLDAIEKMAHDLDSTTPQVEITAKLVDVDAEALRQIGVQWQAGPFQPNNDPAQTLSTKLDEKLASPSATITYGIVKSWGALSAQLDLLEQDRKANVISNPRITTVDNREAKILVGQKIPLIVQDVAGNPVSQLQTIGIQLKVTPHLTDDKKIIMDLHPEVSDLSTQSTVQGGVIINTSEADTRVMVDDGQTAVIGGLIRTNDGTVRRGVPLLKDIPLVGMLFRSNNTVHQNRELIIFVTPRLIGNLASN
jgi:type IV pilus assembly protein PilQ